MFPWVYEFRWTTGHILFLGIFFTVLLTIGSTVVLAAWQTFQTIRKKRQEPILWKADFEDLPAGARACRHELSGKVAQRSCHHGFDCRGCENHQKLLAGQKPDFRLDGRGIGAVTCGLDVPLDRWYHRGHTWVKKEAEGIYSIGLDDFGRRLVGKPDQVELPELGSRLQVNGKGWLIRKKSAEIRILSPLEGEVIDRGGSHQEWYLKVRTEKSEKSLDHLLRGAEVKPWLVREMERLQMALAVDGVGVSLADGGELMYDVTQHDPHADWDSVLGEMFLEP